METKMRYVQQRVENFVLRATGGSISEQWREQDTADDQATYVIVNLSLGGAAMLLPKNLALPANDLRLHIPSPADLDIGSTTLTASVCWTDARYSINRQKIGLHFMEYNDSEQCRLHKLIEWFSVCERTALPCMLQL